MIARDPNILESVFVFEIALKWENTSPCAVDCTFDLRGARRRIDVRPPPLREEIRWFAGIFGQQRAVCHRDVIAVTSQRRDFALRVPRDRPPSLLGLWSGRKNTGTACRLGR